jgi:hypothetical protein
MDENDEIFRRILDDAATRQTVLDHTPSGSMGGYAPNTTSLA